MLSVFFIPATQEFQCHLCEKAYPRADTLKRHILSFHEGKKMYKCEVCTDVDLIVFDPSPQSLHSLDNILK